MNEVYLYDHGVACIKVLLISFEVILDQVDFGYPGS